MDQLCFSEDVNDRIYISVISKNTNATERKINRLPIVCVLTGCVAIITIWLSGIVSLVWEAGAVLHTTLLSHSERTLLQVLQRSQA